MRVKTIGKEMGCFPDEVMFQILARLPVKSLFRARAVCKLWYRLPLDKYFIGLYNQVTSKNRMLLVELSDSSDSKPSLISVDLFSGVAEVTLDFLRDRVKIRASCNGLLCCSSVPDKGVYYVCNPMTREYRLLRRTWERPVTRFYPDGEADLVGLASDGPSMGNFHVVLAGYPRSFGYRSDGTFVCLVYDSSVKRWRKFASGIQDDNSFTHMNKNQVVYVNGLLHWLTSSCSFVLALDFKRDAWKKIWLPNEVSFGVGHRLYLLECDGCLSVIQISEAWIKVWVMKDHATESWSLVDRVSLRCIRGMVPGIFPISQTSEYIYLATHRAVLVYSRATRVWKEMYSATKNSTLPLWFSAHAFRSTISTLDFVQ